MNEPLAQDKQELIREVAEAALLELDKMEKRFIHVSSPRQVLEQLFKGLLDPKPAEETFVAVHPLPVMLPDFPELVRYDFAKGEQEPRSRLWSTISLSGRPITRMAGTLFPPNSVRQIKGRFNSLEAELEKLKAEGVEERLKARLAARKQKEAARK